MRNSLAALHCMRLLDVLRFYTYPTAAHGQRPAAFARAKRVGIAKRPLSLARTRLGAAAWLLLLPIWLLPYFLPLDQVRLTIRISGAASRTQRYLRNWLRGLRCMLVLDAARNTATHLCQFSTCKPVIRLKCSSLLVATPKPFTNAVAAIRISASPINSPRLYKSAYISAA
jgi:hypothetical protein